MIIPELMTDIPWAEKYRPTQLKEIILDDIIMRKIENIFKDKDMPNILITGESGVGKTSLVYCITHTLFRSYSDQGVLELNASDERGIKSVQETVTFFCKKKVDFGKDTENLPRHKIVVLDEADNMSSKAQHLINVLMEEHIDKTRFILTCNQTSKIVEAIQSRCSIIRLNLPSDENIKKRLKHICELEGKKYTDDALLTVAKYSRGDVRTAINNLQLIVTNNNKVDSDYVDKFFNKEIYKQIDKLLISCKKGDVVASIKNVYSIKNDGYSIHDIMQTIFQRLKDNTCDTVDEETKIQFLNIVSMSLYNIGKGLDNDIQLSSTTSEMCLLFYSK